MSEQILLAKSLPTDKDDINMHLISHLKYTYWAAKSIWENVGGPLLEAIGVDPSQNGRFKRILLLAAAAHDLGKANSLFQNVVRGKNVRQSIRHEWLLYILLRRSPLGEWFRKAFDDETDFTYFVWAVIGHHRKNNDENNLGNPRLEFFYNTKEFRQIINWITEELKLESPAPFISDESPENLAIWKNLSGILKSPGKTSDLLIDISNEDFSFKRKFDELPLEEFPKKSSMGSVRSLLMAADVVASAMADPEFPEREDRLNEDKINHWITEHLTNVVPSRSQYEEIITTRERIIETEKGSSPVNEKLNQARAKFQSDVASSKTRVTLVSAGCGSGKTLAAFRWGANQCGKDGSRMFFCYPTTGTATEGFLGYLLDDQNHSMGDLVHSRVSVDFLLNERMRNRASDDEDHRQTIVKSLSLWGTGLVCCTVDTVLGFLVNTYSGHLSIPVFARSIFVFDEIHSYDDDLFDNLLKFLQIFRDLPILLMTASLPKHRLEQIQNVIEKQQHGEMAIIPGPRQWEQINRYRQIKSEEEPTKMVLSHYQKGEKILWICNTVSRAINFAKKIETDVPGCNLIVYHSHFKYKDRCKKHSECIDSFKEKGPVICITTQVAEMSLDISSDFLISDIAPIPALIQRLGRLNRREVKDEVKPFLIIRPKDEKGNPYLHPYVDNLWWNDAERWLKELGDAGLSQESLKMIWEKISMRPEEEINLPSTPVWAEGPETSPPSYLRKPDFVSCEVVLKEDWDKIKHGGKVAYLEHVIPMTKSNTVSNLAVNPQYGCYIVEKDVQISYSLKYGGEWQSAFDTTEVPSIV